MKTLTLRKALRRLTAAGLMGLLALGTQAQVALVKDINPGPNGSDPSEQIDANGTLYFTANDGSSGIELYKSNGTAAGTVLVKDINPNGDSEPYDLTAFNGALYFTADDGVNGYELWKSDGTGAGTVLVKDINPTGDSYAYSFTAFNGVLYFVADDGTHGYELWKSDGTEAGTVLVKVINPTGETDAQNLIAFNGALYFTADDGVNGYELWKSDGTGAGTVLAKDINPTGDSSPQELTVFNGALYFQAFNPSSGYELWKSDGTAAGTVLVKDINSTSDENSFPNSSNPAKLTVANGTLFFTANDGTTGNELWKTDGTEAGTVLVKDLRPEGNSSPRELIAYNGLLYFAAYTNDNGEEIWKSDGTEGGTVRVTDLCPESGNGTPRELTVFNGLLYFTATDCTTGRELWKTDGTGAGTALVKDIYPGDEANPIELKVAGGVLYFTATDGTTGRELYKLGEAPTPCDPQLAGKPTTPARACAGQPLAVTFALAKPCPNPSADAFTVQLSSATGSFNNPRVLGSAQPGTTNVPLPAGLAAGSSYRVRIVGGGQTSAASAAFRVEGPSLSVTPTVSGGPVCRGTNATVNFTLPNGSCPFPNGNTFTAQLSSATGSFNNPTNLGTVQPSGAQVPIPAGVAAGSGYRIRIVSSSPSLTSSNSSPFQIKACPNRMSAEEAQLVVAPNPVTGGEIRVRVTGMDSPAFSLTTATGRRVGVSEKTDGSGEWVLTPKQRLAAGVYLLQASEGQTRLTTRVLVAE